MVDASFVQIGASNISPHFIERGQEASRLQELVHLLVHYQLAGSKDHGTVHVSEVGSRSAEACYL